MNKMLRAAAVKDGTRLNGTNTATLNKYCF